MSGSGRKTNYRKGVTKKVLYDAPEPKENEQIVQVVGLRGSNLFEVRDEHDVSSITMLPTKFRKLIWIKRGALHMQSAVVTRDGWCRSHTCGLLRLLLLRPGDFLIVASGDAAAEASTAKGKKKAAVTSIVEHILYKDQIKHLKAKSLWCDPRRNGSTRIKCTWY